MADEQEQEQTTQEDTGEQVAIAKGAQETAQPALPAHLKPAWFEEGAPVPGIMENNPNWMNVSGSIDETVYVRFPDGSVEPTTSLIHLAHWLLESGAVIIAQPQED